MFCAQTVAAAIEAKIVEEMIQAAIAKAKREQELAEQRKKKNEEFINRVMPEVDAFVEKALIDGKGKFVQLIDTASSLYPHFIQFVEKSNEYRHKYPRDDMRYWSVTPIKDWEIPLEIYVEHLRSLCFEVEVIEAPWTGYSSTGKTSRIVDTKQLIVRVPKDLPCT